MGPIGTVRRSFLSAGYSRGNVKMQLNNVKRVGNDKESLTGLLTVKNGSNQVTESATAKWSSAHEGFKVVSSGVSTTIDGEDSISVVFNMSDLGLKKTMSLTLNKSIDLSSTTSTTSTTTSTTTSSDRTVTALSNYNDLTTVLSDIKSLATEVAKVESDGYAVAQAAAEREAAADDLLSARLDVLEADPTTATALAKAVSDGNAVATAAAVREAAADDLLSARLDTVSDDVEEIQTKTNVKEFYYKLGDFAALTSDGKKIWQDFQYKGIDKDYTGHESGGGSFGDDVKSAHGNEVHGVFGIPLYSDKECSIVMGSLHFVESARVVPGLGFSGEIMHTMAKIYVILNDENTVSYGITSNELLSGFYHLNEDVIVKMISNANSGPFPKNTKVFSDAVDWTSLRIRKINDNIRKCVLSTKEDPVTFDSNLSLLSSPMTSVPQSTETIHKKFYYNGRNFKAVSADGSITVYQDYQYIAIDKNYTGHGEDYKVGANVKNGRGNIARADLSIEITSDRAGLNRIGEMKWIATALIDEPDLAVGSQPNGILTTEEIWIKLDGEDEDTVCIGYAMNRTDGPNDPGAGYYTVGKDIMVKLIKNAPVGPFDGNDNYTNFSNYNSMRIRNIGDGIRECVVSTDIQPPTFEEDQEPVAVTLEQSAADEEDVEFYYSADDFSSGEMHQDYQYVSIDEDYTGHAFNEFGDNVQSARGNMLCGIWCVPLYADSDLTTKIGGITWANSTAIIPEPKLPFMDQDLNVSDQIYITLDNLSTMAVGHTNNIIKGGYYELDKDVLVEIVDNVSQGPLEMNASHTTAVPAFQTCRIRKIDSKLRRGVISKSSIHPALN